MEIDKARDIANMMHRLKEFNTAKVKFEETEDKCVIEISGKGRSNAPGEGKAEAKEPNVFRISSSGDLMGKLRKVVADHLAEEISAQKKKIEEYE